MAPAKPKLTAAARVRRWWRSTLKDLEETKLLLLDFCWYVYTSTKQFCYEKTLPFTRRLFSRTPTPPKVSVKDIRAKRIRLNIETTYSSPFNVEEFEVEWRPADLESEWQSVGKNDLTARTVARLRPDTAYQFRARAVNHLGASGWTPPVAGRTKLDPAEGGGYGPGGPAESYTWTQNATEVCILFKLPLGANKREVGLALTPDSLKVALQERVLLEGELYGSARSWDNGSFWELTKERDHTLLSITLEKQVKSLAPKFDYWRSLVLGHPEIDTHQIVSDASAQPTQMINPAQMDPHQLHSMGLGNLAMGAGAGMAGFGAMPH